MVEKKNTMVTAEDILECYSKIIDLHRDLNCYKFIIHTCITLCLVLHSS